MKKGSKAAEPDTNGIAPGAARADARRKYDPEQTKRNILDVATQEFSAMGLTGARVDAATALRIGLVEDVVDSGAARDAALALARNVARQSPHAVAYSKELIGLARRGVPRGAALAVERERFVDLFDTADPREGVAAFLGKRAPQWRTDGEPQR